ncbi:NADP-dependent oxidoreductase [Streptomyces sp. NPDC096311]|uniref:NADP-dependent oxidoreductase n=1 Tax=Streptomyces sp. NPDC096311 TaxID=3366083 RepID=UPI00381F7FF0
MPRAYVFTEYGGPENQAFLEVPKPSAGPGQLLVAVRAAGVNPVDWKTRVGYLRQWKETPLPAVMGSEVAGVVEEVGVGVEGFEIGDAVFGTPVTGGFAEYTLVPAATAAHKPESVSFAKAAALPVAAATAYDGVRQAGLGAGATLLVTGVGGGVGVAVAQIAGARGIRVVGTASPAKEGFVASLGVVHVAYGDGVAERLRKAAPDGVDAVLDLVGGTALEDAVVLLKEGGPLITAADPATAAKHGGVMIERTATADTLTEVAGLVAEGNLDPLIVDTYPLAAAADALALVEAGHARGKVIIEIS